MSPKATSAPRHAKTVRRSMAGTGVLSLALAGGLFAVANSSNASADTQLVYTCNTAVGARDVTVSIKTNAPATAAVGSTIKITSVTGSIQLDGSIGNAMAGMLQWKSVSGVSPNTVTITTPDGKTTTNNISLDTPSTPIYGTTWVNDGTYGGFAPDGHLVLPITSSSVTSFTASAAGNYTVSAPDSFTSTFTGKTASGDSASIEAPCTYKSGSKVVALTTVSASAASSTTSTSSAPATSTSSSTSAPSSSTTSTSSAPATSTSSSTSAPSSSTTSSTSSSASEPSTSTSSTSAPTDSTTSAPTTSTSEAPAPSESSNTSAPSTSSSTSTSTSSAGSPETSGDSTVSPTSDAAPSTSAAAPTEQTSSASSTTAAPAPTGGDSTPTAPAEGPKVETDQLAMKKNANILGVGFAAAGVAALAGALVLGRREN